MKVATLALLMACPEADEIPVGPCNDDGETASGGDDVGAEPNARDVKAPPTGLDSVRLTLPKANGWSMVPGLDGLVRYATPGEIRRFHWQDQTLVVAVPFGFLDESRDGRAWIATPQWDEVERRWQTDEEGIIRFERRQLARVQRFALGYFVEHRGGRASAKNLEMSRPMFDLFGDKGADGSQMRLLVSSNGGLILRVETITGSMLLSAPHTNREFDIKAPLGFEVAAIFPSTRVLRRNPLVPYDCENGDCEAPDDPLDECNDGLDNDGDGHRDLCDWNCLPHADFGADKFPQARSRVEKGKSYAIMGGGWICTDLQDTWDVTFAEWTLDASDALREIRPGEDDQIRYRVFSCWIFESQEAVQLCQHGPFVPKEGPLADGECKVTWTGPPICPPGLEDYPYQPTETEMQLSESELNAFCGDRNRHYFDELVGRTWNDVELNTSVLAEFGEPVNGAIYMSTMIAEMCLEGEQCGQLAGAAFSPDVSVKSRGFAGVTNANPVDWHTLAHETAHTIGLEHDLIEGGFMNTSSSGGMSPIIDEMNHDVWEQAMIEKGESPRSSGWYHVGCSGLEECAPLGKPGWSCNNLWCIRD